ncbi:unnamed protein product [Closterium sp. Yama58-4]|nr:unnamed protein product [Closterium sp. Yama58-4]
MPASVAETAAVEEVGGMRTCSAGDGEGQAQGRVLHASTPPVLTALHLPPPFVLCIPTLPPVLCCASPTPLVLCMLQLLEQRGVAGRDVVVMASPFTRTQQTAALAAAELGINVQGTRFQTAEELRERYFGRHLELNSHDLYPAVWVDDRKDASSRPGGDGESVVAVAQRTAHLIRHIEEALDGKLVVLVSHGDTLQIINSLLYSCDLLPPSFVLPKGIVDQSQWPACPKLGTTAMVRAAALLLVLPALAILSVVDPEVAKPAWDDGVVDGVDADLFRRAMVQIDDARLAEPRGKIAFLFLVRGPLPLQEIWHRFFQGHEAQFSVYIHASQPDFDCDRAVNYAAFRGRQIPSVPISWGGPNLIRAERRLLAAALADPANQRFVLLSESCVPLFNFSHVYDYLFASPTSFITSHPSEWRYQPGMAPTVNRSQFRKGSQVGAVRGGGLAGGRCEEFCAMK